MIRQPTHEVSPPDVERIVRRDFPAGDVDEATAVLGSYGGESWHRETDRVRLAALKLASGSLASLRDQLRLASVDYRDVIGLAEYPGYLRAGRDESVEELERIIDADWRQYQEWLAALGA